MGSLGARLQKALHPAKPSSDIEWTTGRRWLLAIGSCGYLGYLPASGTVAVAVVAVPLYAGSASLPTSVYIPIVAAFTALAVWVHDRGDRILGEKDSGKLVFDELVGYWIAMVALPVTWQLIVLGFVVERVFDVLKLWPANVLERRVPGGWGVVLDDVVAGLYACGVLHAISRFLPGWVGIATAA